MNIKSIKELADKTPIAGVRGTIEKQYAPADQTENDLKWSQHRQSLLIVDDEGNKLMVTLMKQPLHILDNVEGHELQLAAGRNESGESRGLLVNRWKQRGKEYDSIVVKVYPEATIRAVPPEGQQETQSEPSPEPSPEPKSEPRSEPKAEPKSSGSSQFDKELQLVAYGYCLCLDKSEEIVNDRPLLKEDPESVRAIATNLWMSTKHHVHTLSPNLHGPTKTVSKGAAAPSKKVSRKMSDADPVIIDRCITGHKMAEENDLKENAKAKLDELDSIMDERELWDKAYDQLLIGLVTPRLDEEEALRKAANEVYDETKKIIGESANIEKYFVSGQKAWQEAVTDLAAEDNQS